MSKVFNNGNSIIVIQQGSAQHLYIQSMGNSVFKKQSRAFKALNGFSCSMQCKATHMSHLPASQIHNQIRSSAQCDSLHWGHCILHTGTLSFICWRRYPCNPLPSLRSKVSYPQIDNAECPGDPQPAYATSEVMFELASKTLRGPGSLRL